jgi:hypothetical protein
LYPSESAVTERHMKRIAILVIAATTQPVYVHYIKTYWTELIRHLKAAKPHIDVFLLFEHDTDLDEFSHLAENIIQDRNSDQEALCSSEFHNSCVPGILSKTMHAFELLQDRYDVFYRTNLSSLIRVPYFDQFVQGRSHIGYSGSWVWTDALREGLELHGRIGPDKSIKSLAELDAYPGNTFISGSGYFLNAAEVKSLVQRKHKIRYDIIDDVAIGLMFSDYELLPDFSVAVFPQDSITEIKSRIRRSSAAHVRLQHFPLDRARDLWEHIESGQLWKVSLGRRGVDPQYKIYFPLFDHVDARSNEVRLTHEGLLAHPRVCLVDDPEAADYLIFCQNHLVGHCPFHTQFRPIKDQYKHKTIMLDYDDSPHMIYDADDFRWKLYFKRSCVDRETNRVVDYGDLPILPTAYCVANDMVEPPEGYGETRTISISCLFEDAISDNWVFRRARGKLLKFAKALAAKYDFPMQIGTVSEPGPVGRSAINERYKQCLFASKIILHANPDPWEGDARTWEAVSSGALVFIDRMCQPIPHPLVDGEHVIFYDLTDEGMETLEEKILYYLSHDEERERIGRQGREFALSHHRSIHRVNEIIDALETREADAQEMEQISIMRYLTYPPRSRSSNCPGAPAQSLS